VEGGAPATPPMQRRDELRLVPLFLFETDATVSVSI
jgi:hypothetical protein